ncbi:helix-turn-helix transcriptional regulator [Arthrobacter sp. UYCu712]|uniref:helix-turn-helix domain-containing protein n=1 Tax=Arthrobacter sp. UYCu712 TaxID=3156340 RepID=UPI003394E280
MTTGNYLDAVPARTAAQRAATEIRGLMAARRLRNIDLARALDVSTTTAGNRVSGEGDLSLNDIEAIAAWLDVPVTRIIAPVTGEAFSE